MNKRAWRFFLAEASLPVSWFIPNFTTYLTEYLHHYLLTVSYPQSLLSNGLVLGRPRQPTSYYPNFYNDPPTKPSHEWQASRKFTTHTKNRHGKN